ncbi:hypothetical protein HZH68_016550 [Vespula germanica]|uniref:Uncharacterized protein n=1 Tax=Vespula germanica TaxID=30212 RepID=A0A834MPU8_VESGE|nr:hypothetical protein HZH68_016550 [Vespula germanica]
MSKSLAAYATKIVLGEYKGLTPVTNILLKLRAEAKNEKEDEEGLKTLDGDEEEEEEEEKGVEGELW